MDRIEIQTSDSPDIKIEKVQGSLRIKGWDRPEIRLDSDLEDTAKVTHSDNIFTLKSTSGCLLRTPMESSFSIEKVDSDLILKSIEGSIQAEKISGQVMAKSVGPLSINTISGNLSARNIEGNFSSEQINGNVSLYDVEGQIKIGDVRGNLSISGFSSGIDASCRGNASLKLDPDSGGVYRIKTRGNISCRLSPDTFAEIKLVSNAKQIRISQNGKKEVFNVEEYNFSIGGSDSQIILEAIGRIDLTIPPQGDTDWAFEFDFEDNISAVAEDISQIVTEQIEGQLDNLSIHLSHLSDNLANIGPVASEKARQKLELKRHQLERKLARMERSAEARGRKSPQRPRPVSRKYSFSTSAESDPVSDEERQQVLQMLANKQITVEEAETLLAALEGRQPEFPSSEKNEE